MDGEKPILHIVVVGFHHKKGCQVEYSYPPLVPNREPNACPSGWKYLPTLGLPDGSHNFVQDSVFFNLPSLTDPNASVYGVSCYRQVSVDKLKIRTADVTRSTVQKSVCVLASMPVYGYVEVKLSLIAHAFFEQGDFSCTGILQKAYEQLNSCLQDNSDIPPIRHLFVGLPLRDIVLRWRYKSLILFKLILLQKRVVCFGSPVRPMCSLILAIASLHPDLITKGFKQVACVKTSRPMSPMPNFNDQSQSVDKQTDESTQIECITETIDDPIEECEEVTDLQKSSEIQNGIGKRNDKNSLPRDTSVDALACSLQPFCSISPSTWNAPLDIFTNGNLCLPYLSLPYMDLLSDPSVHGYFIGTSNILFQQKKQLADVLVDVEANSIETADVDLKRQLVLSTEDLRFVDFIIRHVQMPKEDAEGSENWIRDQFQGYMLAMLRTSLLPEGNKEVEHFNGSFMNTWRKTNGYREWIEMSKPDESVFENIPTGHPFAGTLSVADMKLKIAQTMSNSESGRKLNQAVNTTSKAVGGAISHAKGALSNWWSSLSTQSTPVPPNAQSTNSTITDNNIENIESVIKSIDLNESSINANDIRASIVNNQKNIQSVIEQENDKNELNFEHKNAGNKDLQSSPLSSGKCGDVGGIIEIGREAGILDAKQISGESY